jgi:hypothetical protein
MAERAERVETLNPHTGQGPRISRDKYEDMKGAILAALPDSGEGLTLAELAEAAEGRVTPEVFADASIPWFVTTVKLDLEARGLIERVPGAKPQRLRRSSRGR